jgi:hypothetical protein
MMSENLGEGHWSFSKVGLDITCTLVSRECPFISCPLLFIHDTDMSHFVSPGSRSAETYNFTSAI